MDSYKIKSVLPFKFFSTLKTKQVLLSAYCVARKTRVCIAPYSAEPNKVTMEQAVIVEGGVLTGEKIKIKNKTENSPKFQNSSSSTNSETAQENSASSSTNQYVPSSKRRHSAGKT